MKRLIFGFVVGIGIIIILLKRVDLRQLWEILLSVNISFLVLSLFIKVLIMWIKSFRWSKTISSTTGRPVKRAFSASIIGFAGNIILPARLGELARVSVIDKHNHITRTLALTTLGATHLFDLLFLVGYFLIIGICVASYFANYPWEIGLIGIMALLVLGGLVLFHAKFHFCRNLVGQLSSILPKSVEERLSLILEMFVKGLGFLRSSHAVVWVLVLTAIIWIFETSAVYLMLHAFHIKANILMAGLMVVTLNLSFAIPITPGNIGVVQALSIFFLGPFGVTKASALAYSIASQGITYTIIIGLGLIFFYYERMNLNLLGRKATVY